MSPLFFLPHVCVCIMQQMPAVRMYNLSTSCCFHFLTNFLFPSSQQNRKRPSCLKSERDRVTLCQPEQLSCSSPSHSAVSSAGCEEQILIKEIGNALRCFQSEVIVLLTERRFQ